MAFIKSDEYGDQVVLTEGDFIEITGAIEKRKKQNEGKSNDQFVDLVDVRSTHSKVSFLIKLSRPNEKFMIRGYKEDGWERYTN